MNPLISIIIPVYNTEEYVSECLDSIIKQKNDFVECIVVDDGSTDDSLEICRQIKSNNPDCNMLIIHQDNVGLSGARNTGMSHASGEYIAFLDSDDLLAKGALECLKKEIRNSPGIDLLLYDGIVKNETSGSYNPLAYDRSGRIKNSIMSGEEYFCDWYLGHKVFSACMRLYRSGLIKENHICFTPYKLHEDISFGLKAILLARTVLYISNKIYIRRVRNESITTCAPSTKHFEGIYYAFKECLDYVETNIEHLGIVNVVKFSNAFDSYMCFGMEYITATCHNCDGKINDASDAFCRCLEFMLAPISVCSYTRLSAIKRILKIVADENVKLDAVCNNRLDTYYGYHDIQQACSIIDSALIKLRQRIISSLPLNEDGMKIGIYGMGYHTTSLIEEYSSLKEIKADVFFIDTYKSSCSHVLLDKELFNISDIPKDTDCIVISSWIHHDDMIVKVSGCVGNNTNTRVIDLYETEKMPLYG